MLHDKIYQFTAVAPGAMNLRSDARIENNFHSNDSIRYNVFIDVSKYG